MVSMQLVNKNDNSIKKCVFCSNWYDPTSSAIQPKAPAAGFWEFHPRMEAMCLKKNMKTPSFHCCANFICKI